KTSQMELSLFRQRSLEALKQKARRGDLFLTVATGYLKSAHDRIEKDPDLRVQEAIALAFAKFTELQSVRQVHLWMRQERLPLPATEYGPGRRRVGWKRPVYNALRHMLTNPVYAGAYAFGLWIGMAVPTPIDIRTHRQPGDHRRRPQARGARVPQGS